MIHTYTHIYIVNLVYNFKNIKNIMKSYRIGMIVQEFKDKNLLQDKLALVENILKLTQK
jgi:hypothetical protein